MRHIDLEENEGHGEELRRAASRDGIRRRGPERARSMHFHWTEVVREDQHAALKGPPIPAQGAALGTQVHPKNNSPEDILSARSSFFFCFFHRSIHRHHP